MTYRASRDWFIDYSDQATQTTPLAYTTGDLQLTCDWAWPYWTAVYKPMWITRLRNTTTSEFDFTLLDVWDEVTLRFDIAVTTSSTNQTVRIFARFDIWWTPFDLTLDHQHFKTAWEYNIVETEMFYIGSAWMKNNPGRLYIASDDDASIKVNWFYISVKRR